uniref:Ovule protein n=1 Tax=Steinernema glaseri TaxID=37863 RepID=A0A1I7Z1P9_9BILA
MDGLPYSVICFLKFGVSRSDHLSPDLIEIDSIFSRDSVLIRVVKSFEDFVSRIPQISLLHCQIISVLFFVLP